MYDNQHKTGKQHKGTPLKHVFDPFDIPNLSSAYGPRTTETLIEAIFNPVPTHSEKESPFTFYVPYAPRLTDKTSQITFASTGESGSLNGHGSIRSTATSSDYASAPSRSPSGKPPSLSSQSGHSFSSHGHSSESGVGGGEEERHKPWWRKIGHSRPGTPAH